MFSTLKEKFFGSQKNSKSLAKSRLHFVLVQDRTGLTNEQMAQFREEIVNVLERYFVIDKQAFDISYQRDSDTSTLLINSPVIVHRKESPGGEVGARSKKRNRGKAGATAANA